MEDREMAPSSEVIFFLPPNKRIDWLRIYHMSHFLVSNTDPSRSILSQWGKRRSVWAKFFMHTCLQLILHERESFRLGIWKAQLLPPLWCLSLGIYIYSFVPWGTLSAKHLIGTYRDKGQFLHSWRFNCALDKSAKWHYFREQQVHIHRYSDTISHEDFT